MSAWAEIKLAGEAAGYKAVRVNLDTCAEMDFVSRDLVQALKLKPCRHKSHQAPSLEAAGRLNLQQFGCYHFRIRLTDEMGREMEQIRSFTAIERDPDNAPFLIGMPLLKEWRIHVDCENGTWAYKQRTRVKKVSLA